MKNHAIVLLALLATVGAAQAQSIDGGIAIGGTGSYTSASLTLNPTQLVESNSGDLSSADSLSFATAYSQTVSGLSDVTETLTTPIDDYFQFSTAGVPGSTGTTPPNRFDFELIKISEDSSNAFPTFYGSGMLIDTTGALASAPATFTLDFSGSASESFTLDTVATPEPSSWLLALLACGLLGLLAYRRQLTASV